MKLKVNRDQEEILILVWLSERFAKTPALAEQVDRSHYLVQKDLNALVAMGLMSKENAKVVCMSNHGAKPMDIGTSGPVVKNLGHTWTITPLGERVAGKISDIRAREREAAKP